MWHGRAKKRRVFTQAVSGPMKKGGERDRRVRQRVDRPVTAGDHLVKPHAPVRPDQFEQHAPPHPVPPAPNRIGSYSARLHTFETVSIFNLGLPPPLPEPAAKAARTQAGARYDNFVAALGRRLKQGPKAAAEIPEDVNGRQAED
jgi:hypothetical protein